MSLTGRGTVCKPSGKKGHLARHNNFVLGFAARTQPCTCPQLAAHYPGSDLLTNRVTTHVNVKRAQACQLAERRTPLIHATRTWPPAGLPWRPLPAVNRQPGSMQRTPCTVPQTQRYCNGALSRCPPAQSPGPKFPADSPPQHKPLPCTVLPTAAAEIHPPATQLSCSLALQQTLQTPPQRFLSTFIQQEHVRCHGQHL